MKPKNKQGRFFALAAGVVLGAWFGAVLAVNRENNGVEYSGVVDAEASMRAL
jgi:hypothetical protein